MQQLGPGALLFVPPPLNNLVVIRRHLGIALAKGDRVRACIDLGLLTIGAVLEAITWMVAWHGRKR
ncbi:hypothetical protein [Belnapia moabensis]|uniref:hypothetical protein n=1 Tax=Belnapia moabensis TaxID=365533 RepID=UPI0005BE75C5|nr:hypothetical protein [Belnapia moabensis]